MSPRLQKFFAMGEEDHGKPFHDLYDTWIISEQQAYEDGRLSAAQAAYKRRPRSLK